MALTAIALLLWSHSIVCARLEIGYLGLVHGLPVTFFLATGFLTAAAGILWLSGEGHGKLMAAQTVLFVCALWLVPQVTGGSPPFDDHAYRNLRLIDQVMREGHFSAQETGYLSWPGAFLWLASLSGTLGVEPEALLHLWPVVMQLALLLPLYIFLKNLLGEDRQDYCWMGLWLFSLASWTGRQYLASAPGVTLLLLLALLALVTTPALWEKGRRSLPWLGLTLAVFVGLVLTHLLTSLAALGIIGALTVARKSRIMVPVTAACLVMLVSWNLTGMERDTILGAFSSDVIAPGESMEAIDAAEMNLPGEKLAVPTKEPVVSGRSLVFSPAVFVESQVSGHLAGSGSHAAVTGVRVWFSAAFALIGLAGAIGAAITRQERNTTIAVLALTLAPLALAVIPYGGRSIDHLYVFCLAPMAYFGARLLESGGRVAVLCLCLVLAAAVPFHLIAHYGNQTYDYFPPSLVRGLEFSYESAPADPAQSSAYPWGILEPVKEPFVRLNHLQWNGDTVTPRGGFTDGSPRWLYLHRRHDAYYGFLLGEPSFLVKLENALAETANCGVVYRNPDFRLYRLEPPTLDRYVQH